LFVACKEEEEEVVVLVVVEVLLLATLCSGSIASCLTVTGVAGAAASPSLVTLLSPSSLSALLLHFCAADGQHDVTFGHTFKYSFV